MTTVEGFSSFCSSGKKTPEEHLTLPGSPGHVTRQIKKKENESQRCCFVDERLSPVGVLLALQVLSDGSAPGRVLAPVCAAAFSRRLLFYSVLAAAMHCPRAPLCLLLGASRCVHQRT